MCRSICRGRQPGPADNQCATLSSMGLKITELGVTVPGQVTRKFDKGANTPTLVVNEDQLRNLAGSADLALKIFDTQAEA
jgi:hypothetical protein